MKDLLFTIEENAHLNDNVYKLKLVSEKKIERCRCGQFINVEVKENGCLLRRPFCVYESGTNFVTIIVANVGKGSNWLVNAKIGEKIKGIVPIGRGFMLTKEHKKIALIGGGVGVAPLLSVTKDFADKEYYSFLGFANKDKVILENDFKNATKKTIVSTDDGSYGFKGYVTDAFLHYLDEFKPDVILTCGSNNMMKGVARVAKDKKIPAFMSSEARMACGVGACLVCACAIRQENGEILNKRGCVDGPVFALEDIIL